jgi:hypothetical protein
VDAFVVSYSTVPLMAPVVCSGTDQSWKAVLVIRPAAGASMRMKKSASDGTLVCATLMAPVAVEAEPTMYGLSELLPAEIT